MEKAQLQNVTKSGVLLKHAVSASKNLLNYLHLSLLSTAAILIKQGSVQNVDPHNLTSYSWAPF